MCVCYITSMSYIVEIMNIYVFVGCRVLYGSLIRKLIKVKFVNLLDYNTTP